MWGYDYTETNGWGYAFTAPQDSRGLANLYGGRAGLGEKLDTYFSTPETASPEFVGSYGSVIHEMTEARDVRMGMYGHSNQVAHHVTYMYNAASQPWKTQEKVREVLSRLYTGSEIGQGYHGDEDNGEQSAWYLFSALGFYPLVMGSGEYAIGSPLFTKATVHLENGRDLVVKAPKNSAKNIYVQGLKVNGKAWNSTALPHELIARGGTLEFAMGAEAVLVGHGQERRPGLHHPGRQGAVAAPRCDHRAAVRSSTTPRRRRRRSRRWSCRWRRGPGRCSTRSPRRRGPRPRPAGCCRARRTGRPGRTWTSGPARPSPGTGRPASSRSAAPGSYAKYRLVADGRGDAGGGRAALLTSTGSSQTHAAPHPVLPGAGLFVPFRDGAADASIPLQTD